MSRSSEWGEDPEHSILPHAHLYAIVGIHLDLEPADGSEPFLDLTVQKGGERRKLRFWGPTNLEIERGGPQKTGGFQILDMSARGLDRMGVRVDDFEASNGAVFFVARAVEYVSTDGAG